MPHLQDAIEHFFWLSNGRSYSEHGPDFLDSRWVSEYLRDYAGISDAKQRLFNMTLIQTADRTFCSELASRS